MEGGTTTKNFGNELNSKLQENVNPNDIGSQFLSILPWVGSLIMVVFVITKGIKLMKGASKGKVRL